MPRMASKRAWLLLAASVTLHLIILSSTKIIGDRTATTPGRRLIRRYMTGDPSYSASDVLLDLPYSEWYDNMPPAMKPFYILVLLVILAFLFSFIGISASDFFCPNLSTIASYLGLNESTAGVTFLAFGNGSPDVFSTFSAMKGGTFGLAVGELIGAASFIVSIVVGSIALIRPFHVPRHAFLRDVLFFTAAVVVLMVVLRDGHLTLWESSGMVALYVAYVGVVVGGNWWGRRKRRNAALHIGSSHHQQKSPKLNGGSRRGEVSSIHSSPFLSPVPQPIPDVDDVLPVETPSQLTPTTPRPHMGRTRSHTSASHLGGRPSHLHLHHHDSIDTPRANFSLLGAIEFRDVVNSLRKESNSREGSPNRSPLREGDEEDYFGPAAASAYGHRRSSSYGFSAALQGGSNVRRTSSMKGNRRRASTHTSPTGGDGSRSVSTPAAVPAPAVIPAPPAQTSLGVSPEPNPWEDQTGHPPTPAPPFGDALESPKRPNRPKVVIPGSTRRPDQPVRPIVPSIALVDPSGHTGVPASDQSTPPVTPPLKVNGKAESRFAIRRRSKLILRVLFPSLQSFRHKSIIGMILAVTSVPAILVLTLTLPVVDDGGQNDEGGVALPIGEGEALNEGAQWDDDDEERTFSDSSSQNEEGEEEADRLLLPEIGEELHHLVDHGFSPLHSPLGRISHAALRRASEHIEAGGEVGSDDLGVNGNDHQGIKEEVYEEIEEEQGLQYNKHLTAAQCFFGPSFCAFIVFGDESYLLWILLGTSLAGLAGAAVVILYSTDGSSYTWRLVRCSCGFICSMVWIAAIADEVVGVLNTVGEIMGLSDAIIGLTIFAIGNSLADLVANVTVAQFAPAMAYAACFGGPMLNLLLGVGGSGTYHILVTPSHHPVAVHFSPTLWVSASGLVLILLATAVVVPMNGYLIDRKWAGALIVGYLALMVVNVVVEIKTGRG
ncbi:hypothetical protein I317_00615 [Kwoniella heveanensis CBS 569]|nr:hypothetical protein I317_00615 [Kwoniella heveanensis CBS 569]